DSGVSTEPQALHSTIIMAAVMNTVMSLRIQILQSAMKLLFINGLSLIVMVWIVKKSEEEFLDIDTVKGYNFSVAIKP
ncbi:MAG: hypothetical protein U0M06_07325, partial [Clostridia bacterium]|nr:hypothetical protein [Clostridia bacterium]